MRVNTLILAVLLSAWAVSAQAVPLSQALEAFGMQQPQVRKLAPDFSLPSLDGGTIRLSDFRGKLVLLHFWATWCVPCRHELPLLPELEAELPNDRFRIVCVNANRGDSRKVKSFMDDVAPQFHTLLDPQGVVRNHYAVRGLPTTYLIAPDGRIIGRMIGERLWNSDDTVSLFRRLLDAYSMPDKERK